MELILYYTRDSNNTINKVLENNKSLYIHFKEVANVIKPVVKLRYNGALNYNYAYIPEFDKYYFITDMKIFPNNIHTLQLETDVLETYKDDILQSEGTVSRSKYSNDYYDGGDYRSEEKKEHVMYESDKEVRFKDNTILVTIGG